MCAWDGGAQYDFEVALPFQNAHLIQGDQQTTQNWATAEVHSLIEKYEQRESGCTENRTRASYADPHPSTRQTNAGIVLSSPHCKWSSLVDAGYFELQP